MSLHNTDPSGERNRDFTTDLARNVLRSTLSEYTLDTPDDASDPSIAVVDGPSLTISELESYTTQRVHEYWDVRDQHDDGEEDDSGEGLGDIFSSDSTDEGSEGVEYSFWMYVTIIDRPVLARIIPLPEGGVDDVRIKAYGEVDPNNATDSLETDSTSLDGFRRTFRRTLSVAGYHISQSGHEWEGVMDADARPVASADVIADEHVDTDDWADPLPDADSEASESGE